MATSDKSNGTTNVGSSRTQVVTKLGPDDILFGRGAPIVQTSGNVRFRDLVNTNKAAYAGTRCRQTKDSIARDIIHVIENRGGKFLKEIKSAEDVQKYGVTNGVKAWIVAEYDEVVEKVKQTLRETEKNTVDAVPSNSSNVAGSLNASNVPARVGSSVANVNRSSGGQLNDQFHIPYGHVTASLFPHLHHQQMLGLQTILRQNQIQQHRTRQQGLADVLQQYQQHQHLLRVASLATTATGGITPNFLSHQTQLATQSSSRSGSQLSMDDYLLAMRGVQSHSVWEPNSQISMPSIANNNYPPVASTTGATSSLYAIHEIEEMLQQDTTLAALRQRHQPQIEGGLQQQSSSTNRENLHSATELGVTSLDDLTVRNMAIANVDFTGPTLANTTGSREEIDLYHKSQTRGVPLHRPMIHVRSEPPISSSLALSTLGDFASTVTDCISHPVDESNTTNERSSDQGDESLISLPKEQRPTKKQKGK